LYKEIILIRSLLRNNKWQLLKQSILAELSHKHAGSIMGVLWIAVYPFFLFSIYVVLYSVIFRVRPSDMTTTTYVAYILSGLIPFLSFSESLTSGTGSILAKKQLLLNTIYPSEFIPLQTVISSHISILPGIILLLVYNGAVLHVAHWTYLLIPILVILQIMFVAGIVWFLSILNLVMRDIQQILGLIIMLLMILSPVAYTPSMVPNTLKIIIWLNPFSYFVFAYQDIFVYGVVSSSLFIAAALSLVFFATGYVFFQKVKTLFYDYV
jgi:lipopolysaccharide transport system permease protein